MKLNNAGIQLITASELFRSKPYICPAGVPTIGYGTTVYPNGRKVSLSDVPITKEVAHAYKMHDLRNIERDLRASLKVTLSENRFSALCSLIYNIGIGSFRKSTLLKVVNAAPGAPGIRMEFNKYVKARDPKTNKLVVLPGLVVRRKEEADLYFSN